ncbi:MAG TPA: GNVR domain-containing protein, partial [Flavihumibacter sp.]
LYADVEEETKFRKLPAYLTSPIKVRFKDPGRIRGVEKVPFTFNRETRTVTIGKDQYPINQWVDSKWGDIRFVPNYKYNGDTVQRNFHFMLYPPRAVQASLLARIKVVPASKLATVINLSIKDQIADRAEDILNELVKVYTEAEIEDKNQRAANTVAMVENRIRSVAGQLDSVETEIQRYRTTSGVIDISTQGRQYLENVGQYDRELEQIKNQIAVLDEVEKFILQKEANNSAIVPSAVGVNDPALNQMLDKLTEYQLQYEKLKRTTGENSPILINLRTQIETLKPGILENIRNQKISLNISRNSYATTGNRYSAMLSTIPQKEKQLIEISRQQAIKNQLYAFLLEKREEAALSFISSNKGDTRIIDKAYSSVMPVSPNKFILYLAAVVLALGLGMIWVSVKEDLNKKTLFRSELEKMSNVPVVGEVLFSASRDPFLVRSEPTSIVAGQVKSLRNHLFFGANNNQQRKLVITSAGRGEGKSFIASNLAISLAQTNARVVLIDLDFYTREISSLYNLDNAKGVVDYLKGQQPAASLVKADSTTSGLYILPVGASSEENAEWLMSGKLEELINELASSYDYIVMAGPAFSDDVNIQAISHIADASLFVIRQGVTSKANLTMLQYNGHIEGLKNPGFVFNAVKGRGWGVKMFGNGYGYGNTPGK